MPTGGDARAMPAVILGGIGLGLLLFGPLLIESLIGLVLLVVGIAITVWGYSNFTKDFRARKSDSIPGPGRPASKGATPRVYTDRPSIDARVESLRRALSLLPPGSLGPSGARAALDKVARSPPSEEVGEAAAALAVADAEVGKLVAKAVATMVDGLRPRLRRMRADGPDVTGCVHLAEAARACLSAGDYEGALASAKKAIELGRSSA
jgi:hypothetical protein